MGGIPTIKSWNKLANTKSNKNIPTTQQIKRTIFRNTLQGTKERTYPHQKGESWEKYPSIQIRSEIGATGFQENIAQGQNRWLSDAKR